MLKTRLNSIITLTSIISLTAILPTFAANSDQNPFFPTIPDYDSDYYCIAGYVGIAGVQMTGLPGNVISDVTGHYQALIPKGDQPMVIPMKEGFEFNPKGKIYNHISENLLHQDYLCTPATFVISGTVGHGQVNLKGFSTPVVTDEKGRYSVTVPYGWHGRIIPEKEGVEFTPAYRDVTAAISDLSNLSFKSHFKTVTVSGAIIVGNCPLSGVRVRADYGGGADITDELGRFYIEVPYGWTGDLTPYKKGYTFNPPSLSYDNIQEDIDSISNQNKSRFMITNRTNPESFDISHKTSCEDTDIPDNPIIATASEDTQTASQIKNDLRIISAIMDERLGAFSTQTQGIYVKDYGLIFHSQVKPVFTFEGTPMEAAAASYNDSYLDQLKDNTIKLMSYISNIQNIDPNQWIVITLAMPDTFNHQHAMTLQTRKHEIDALAAQQISMSDFKHTLKITIQ